MIELVTGKLGAGKSFHVIHRARVALKRGQYVATNVELTDDWAERFVGPWGRRETRARKAAGYRDRMYVTGDLDELARLRLPACGKCSSCKRGGKYCLKEGRGLMVLDECHYWLNSRTWNAGSGDERSAVMDRKRLVDFFTMVRKLGWHVVLVSHAAEQIDAQVRRLVQYHTSLRNLRKVKQAGVTVFPVTLFVAITTLQAPSAPGKLDVMKRDWYRLNRRLAGAYESMALVGGWAEAPDLIQLGLPAASASGAAVRSSPPAAPPRLPSGPVSAAVSAASRPAADPLERHYE
jgi:hypothetical protein